MIQFTPDQFDRIRSHAAELYRGLGKIRCPYFGAPVHFSTEGFHHLLFKSWNRGRSERDQFMRLKFLRYAPEIVRTSRTLQGIQTQTQWHRRHRHGVWEKTPVAVTYYEFVAIIELRRFKVILRRVGEGQLQFWSLIPFWRQSASGAREMHDGLLEFD